VTASQGALALDLIRTRPPDLILLDMRMPDMDGGAFAEAYRQLPGRRAPLIVLTAARDAAERAAQLEADAFLPKPFDIEALLDLVGRLAGGPTA
jgi:CheY-like chemotaxis protein